MRILLSAALVLALTACSARREPPAPEPTRPAPELRDDSWSALDLAGLRGREPGASAADRPAALPVGDTQLEGKPLRFAREGEPWDLPARGQRIVLSPKEGGRYYELALAVEWTGEEEGALALEALGEGDLARAQPFVLARGAVPQLVRVPIATSWPCVALRLPDDEHLHVYAAALRWVPDAPSNADFRRALLANELRTKEMRRYLRNLEVGGQFHDLAGEAEHEREMFDRLVAGDAQGAQAVLSARLGTLDALNAGAKSEHVHVCLVLPPRGGRARLDELRTLVAALDADADLRGALGGIDVVRELEASDAAAFARLDALVKSGRLELAGLQEHLEWGALPDELALREAFDSGLQFAAQHGWLAKARAGVLGDLDLQPLLPQWCQQTQLVRCVQWSEGPESARVPPVFGWKSGNGPALVVVHLPAASASVAGEDLGPRLARSRESFGNAELFVTLELGAEPAEAARRIGAARALAEEELGPKVDFLTPTGWFEELRQHPRFQLAAWQPRAGQDLGPDRRGALALRQAARRAEVELESASRAGALAQMDGLSFLRSRFDPLRAAQRAALARSDAAAGELLEEIAAHARGITREALGVLARTARTRGEGEPVVVFNLLPFERTGVIELDGALSALVDPDGKPVPVQRAADGARVAWVHVPGLGHAVFHARANANAGADAEPAARREDWSFTSSRLALRLDPATGEIASLRVLPEGLELLAPNSNLCLWQPAPLAGSPRAVQPLRKPDSIDVVEDGPVRLVVRVVRHLGEGSLVEDLILERDRPELLLRCRAEGWREAGTLALCLALPARPKQLSAEASGASFALESAGRDGTAWVGMRRFVGAASEGWGLALLQAGGARFAAGGARLTLELAQGGAPGACETSFALRPFLEQGSAGNLAAYADDLTWPLACVRTNEHAGVRPARHSYLDFARGCEDGASIAGARCGLELLALEPRPTGYELLVRERFGEAGELELELDRNLFAAESIDLKSGAASPLVNDHRRVRLALAPGAAARVRLRLRP